MSDIELPDAVEYVRTTPMFTEATVPTGLLGEHRVAAQTWGLLTVHTGSLIFLFDDAVLDGAAFDGAAFDEAVFDEENGRQVVEGETQVIPPARPHHLEVQEPVVFDVAFYRETDQKG